MSNEIRILQEDVKQVLLVYTYYVCFLILIQKRLKYMPQPQST